MTLTDPLPGFKDTSAQRLATVEISICCGAAECCPRLCHKMLHRHRWEITFLPPDLAAKPVQPVAVSTKPTAVHSQTTLVMWDVTARRTCAVVVVNAAGGWLFGLIDGVERWRRRHGGPSPSQPSGRCWVTG